MRTTNYFSISKFQLIAFAFFIGISSCSQPDKEVKETKKVKRSSDWRKLDCGLYMSPEGELGFPTVPEIANIPDSELGAETCENSFLTNFGYDQIAPLDSVIDTLTFESLGDNFYRDRSNIYHHYTICESGYLHIFVRDTATFRLLDNCYASYQSEIYQCRIGGPLDVDAATFRIITGYNHLAKDKDGFIEFGERISEEDLEEHMGKENWLKVKGL